MDLDSCPTDALITRMGGYMELSAPTSYDPIVETITVDDESKVTIFGSNDRYANASATTMERGLIELFAFVGNKKHKKEPVIPKSFIKKKGKYKLKPKPEPKSGKKQKKTKKIKSGGNDSDSDSDNGSGNDSDTSTSTSGSESYNEHDELSTSDESSTTDELSVADESIDILEFAETAEIIGADETADDFDIMNFADN